MANFEADPVMPGLMQNIMNEADADHFDEGQERPRAPMYEEEEDADKFDGDVEGDVLGLLNLGSITRKFDVLGHTFVFKTLTIGEELAIGQIIDEYAGTIGQGKAFQTALIAAAIVSVDGRPLVAQLGPDTKASLQDRFDYITDNWYMKTIEAAFESYNELLLRQQAAYDAILLKSKASRTTSTP